MVDVSRKDMLADTYTSETVATFTRVDRAVLRMWISKKYIDAGTGGGGPGIAREFDFWEILQIYVAGSLIKNGFRVADAHVIAKAVWKACHADPKFVFENDAYLLVKRHRKTGALMDVRKEARDGQKQLVHPVKTLAALMRFVEENLARPGDADQDGGHIVIPIPLHGYVADMEKECLKWLKYYEIAKAQVLSEYAAKREANDRVTSG